MSTEPIKVRLRGIGGEPRGVTRTVWSVINKGAVRTCRRCGKRYRKHLVIYSPSDFAKFWSLAEVLRETKAGYDPFCNSCAIEEVTA
jgi:hypothetical protein